MVVPASAKGPSSPVSSGSSSSRVAAAAGAVTKDMANTMIKKNEINFMVIVR